MALIGDTVYKGDSITYMWILKDYHNPVWVKKRILCPVSWINCGQPVPIGTISTGEILLSRYLCIRLRDLRGCFSMIWMDEASRRLTSLACLNGFIQVVLESSEPLLYMGERS